MKTLYFDLIGGISGDMTVASLLDLGVSFNFLKRELKKISVGGYRLEKGHAQRGHVKAALFSVIVSSLKNYSYLQIVKLIKASRLSGEVKTNILRVYEALAKAERIAHGHRHGGLDLKQLGDIDSIIDIAAACIALEKIGAREIFYSVIPVNKAIAPATLELIKEKKVYFTGSLYENVTPTGMAILSVFGKQIDTSFKNIFLIERCGYGAGCADPVECSNVLRAVVLKRPAPAMETDEALVIESNIDDMNPQFFDYLFEKLFEAGAMDVFIENVIMKKTRPGFLLTILSNAENLGKISALVLSQTSSIGLRFYPVQRLKLSRRIEHVAYMGIKARVKLAYLPSGGLKVSPEYEDCKILAKKTNEPISKIYNDLKKKAELKWRSRV
ncbi:MAG: hypothetical protein AUJ74_00100 [Candidatus Omnitrophica bacterium CG1_02_44_16]|nr:MAG: hypothetical protein AUJ74_00100 [Candidatus Omnitrophica bacterium CG1_02_44_16]PIY82117.1 MAG: hypothetical protein COY78_08310 [Candidatus Omnitrophica bacterium CG_4_10_14_0_8_um_filter_44_12]